LNEDLRARAQKVIERENINSWDWEHAERYCALYLERELYDMAKTFVDESRAVSTAIIVTYARPFSVNRDRNNKRELADQKYVDALDSPNRTVHDRIINLRNRAFAHSDAEYHNVKVELTEGGGVSTLATDPLIPLERTEVETLQANIHIFKVINDKLRSDANAKLLSCK
jgi:hypothetical protein